MLARQRVHLIEPGGRGGVFQHTVELARLLQEADFSAVVHTAADYEPLPIAGIEFCGCVDWHRDAAPGVVRKLRIIGSYLLSTLPHLRRSVTADQLSHVQGLFASPLYAVTLLVVRRRGNQPVFSPHNTFSRAGRKWQELVLRFAARKLAGVLVVFSQADADRVRAWGVTPVLSPLVLLTPTIDPARVAAWRTRLAVGRDAPIVLVPGQIRTDKGIDVVIRASSLLQRPVRVAVVGEDHGDLERCKAVAADYGVDVHWDVGYYSLEDFTAAIAAADAVAVAYPHASQSGVLALATAVGTPSIASGVGGLGEQASVVATQDDDAAFAAAIARVLDAPPIRPERGDPTERIVAVYPTPTARAKARPQRSRSARRSA